MCLSERIVVTTRRRPASSAQSAHRPGGICGSLLVPSTGWPGARSSGGCGLARPVVPGGVSLLALLVSTPSSVVTTAASTAMIAATAKSRTDVRWLFHSLLMRGGPPQPPKRNTSSIVPRLLPTGLSYVGYCIPPMLEGRVSPSTRCAVPATTSIGYPQHSLQPKVRRRDRPYDELGT